MIEKLIEFIGDTSICEKFGLVLLDVVVEKAYIDSLLKMDDAQIVTVGDPHEKRRDKVAKQTAT